jgi:PilZ domain
MTSDRRKFARLRLSTEAIAFDENGKRLGFVTEAGGGGMAITLDPGISPHDFELGAHLRITIVEPQREIRNCLRAELRYIAENVLGLAFVASKAARRS